MNIIPRLKNLNLALAILCSVPAHAATTIWAGTQAGVYKSIDSGTTWQPVPLTVSNPLLQGTNPQTPDVAAIALDPQQPSTVYFVGTNQGSSGIGFYRSTDNGKTWAATVLIGIPITDPISFWTTWILVDPVVTNVIYLGWQGGVARSTDYGATFTKLNMPTNPNSGGNKAVPDGLGIDSTTSGVLYMSALQRVWRSADFGDNWTLLPPVVSSANALRLGNLVVDPKNNNVLYVGNSGGGSPLCGPNGAQQICGLFRSPDGGQNWKNVTPAGEYHEVVFDARSSDLYVSGSAVGLGGSVFKSTDGGNNWNPVSNKTADHLVADPAASGNLYGFSFNSNAWVKSTDGGATFATGFVVITGNSRNVHQLVVPGRLGNVLGASFQSGPVTPESIVSALGFNLATSALANTADPVPTSLNGTTVTVVDSTGASRPAPLFYVSPGQVNYEIPAGTALGIATVIVRSGDGVVSTAPLGIASVVPGLFALNPAGLVAAYALRVSGGKQTYENVYQVDASNAVIPNPINLGPDSDQVYLLLFGTGIRNATTVTATVGGVGIPVLSAGAQGQFIGEDQVNIGPLPRSLAGSGNVALVLTADGKTANSVNVTIK